MCRAQEKALKILYKAMRFYRNNKNNIIRSLGQANQLE